MSAKVRLLLVGKLDGQLQAAQEIAEERGYRLFSVDNISDAMVLARRGVGVDIAIVDVALNVGDMIAELVTERIALPVVACGREDASVDVVRDAIKAGAVDYLPLPPDPELIADFLETLSNRNNTLISHDPLMVAAVSLAKKVSRSTASVLITGETGSGKEVIARYVHEQSLRKNERFVAVNCAAIPDTLLESELFGHEKGAFSGALARRIGKFEEANGGTLLLDEISEMDLRLQAKLLRVIQEREVDRLGSSKPVSIDIRILATSNRDLPSVVAHGDFREDLYYRLNVIEIKLPALRERQEDIVPLAQHFTQYYAQLNGVESPAWEPQALKALTQHSWPGNVREMENLCHRAVLLCDNVIDEKSITQTLLSHEGHKGYGNDGDRSSVPTDSQPSLIGRSVHDVEKELILKTVAHYKDNNIAAAMLGISIRALREKVKRYGDTHSIS